MLGEGVREGERGGRKGREGRVEREGRGGRAHEGKCELRTRILATTTMSVLSWLIRTLIVVMVIVMLSVMVIHYTDIDNRNPLHGLGGVFHA